MHHFCVTFISIIVIHFNITKYGDFINMFVKTYYHHIDLFNIYNFCVKEQFFLLFAPCYVRRMYMNVYFPFAVVEYS